jgi:excinuclease UvrABC nuclease subunit
MKTPFPAVPAVYVVYVDGFVYYVGSTANLRLRMINTWNHKNEDANLRPRSVVVKFSISRRYGDWRMREVRLIRRLHPRANLRDTGRPRKQTERLDFALYDAKDANSSSR